MAGGRGQELILQCQMELFPGPWCRPGTGCSSGWHCSAILLKEADSPLWADARDWGQQLVPGVPVGRAGLDAAPPSLCIHPSAGAAGDGRAVGTVPALPF